MTVVESNPPAGEIVLSSQLVVAGAILITNIYADGGGNIYYILI